MQVSVRCGFTSHGAVLFYIARCGAVLYETGQNRTTGPYPLGCKLLDFGMP